MVDFDHSKFHILVIDVLAVCLCNFKSVILIFNELQHYQGPFFWCMSYPCPSMIYKYILRMKGSPCERY